MSSAKGEKKWWVYILQCSDKTLYCGSTSDIKRRLAEHENGQGAKYTRGRSPLTLLFKKRVGTKSKAFSLEYRIKQLPRREKFSFIKKKAF